MIIWVRNIILILFVLSIIYVSLRLTSRFMRREKLISEYKADPPDMSKEEFIAAGLKKYDRSLRPKLFIFVYIIPVLVMGVLIYLAQYS